MSFTHKAVITVAAFGQLLSNFVLIMFDSVFFRPFFLSSDVSDPFDTFPPGLEGNPLNIVRVPAIPILGIFLVSVTLHIYHCKDAEVRAKRQLIQTHLNMKQSNVRASAHLMPTILGKELGHSSDKQDVGQKMAVVASNGALAGSHCQQHANLANQTVASNEPADGIAAVQEKQESMQSQQYLECV